MRVSGQSALSSVLEKTTFGISFIGAAKTASEVGQVAAISSYVCRPLTWVPAFQSTSSTTHWLSSSSKWRMSHSASSSSGPT
jgi:hypothetical protein